MNIVLKDKAVFTPRSAEKALIINGKEWGELIIYGADHKQPYHAVIKLPYRKTTGGCHEIAQGHGTTAVEAITEAVEAMREMVESINANHRLLLTDLATHG